MTRLLYSLFALTGLFATQAMAQGAPTGLSWFPPTGLVFPLTYLSKTVDRTLTLQNAAAADITLTQVAAAAPFSVKSQTCTAKPLAKSGGSCAVVVTFSPSTAGSNTGTLTVTPGGGNAFTVPLAGAAASFPNPLTGAVAPRSLTVAFDTLAVGSKQSQTLTVTNASNAVQSVVLAVSAGDFTLANNGCAGLALNSGASCTVTLAFSPTAAGSRTGQLTVTPSLSAPTPVVLTGTGKALTNKQLQAAPGLLLFPSTEVGTTAQALAVKLTSTGTQAVTLKSVTSTSPTEFPVTQNCSPSLSPTSSCTAYVAFKPSLVGGRSASLQIVHDGDASPAILQLGGNGVASTNLWVEPSAIDFGYAAAGTSTTPRSVVFYNSGTTPVALQRPTLSASSNAAFSIASTTCTASLAPETSCQANVVFSPTTAQGGLTGAVELRTTDNQLAQVVPLAGDSLAPQGALKVSATALTFPVTMVGASSDYRAVTFANTGTAPVTFSGVTATSFDYSWINGCTGSLAAGASCKLSVRFNPASAGTKNATLNVANSGTTGAIAVTLSGSAALSPGNPVASPTSLAFGAVNLGVTSAAQTVRITNQGGQAVALTGVTPSSTEFSVSANTCPSTLAAGATCTVGVQFVPKTGGLKTAKLNISHPGSLTPVAVSLSGTGNGAPDIALAPPSLTFATTAVGTPAAEQKVTVTNRGSGVLRLSQVVLSSAEFTQRNDCGAGIQPGAACSIWVSFAPSVGGPKTGTLTLSHNVGAGSSAVALSGTAVMVNAVATTPTNVVFADTRIGQSSTTTLTLKNTGSGAVSVAPPVAGASAEFKQSGWTCGSTMAAGASCVATLQFSPATVGSRSGTLAYSVEGKAQTITVSGNGLSNALASLSPAALTFAATPVGQAATQALVLTNTGATPLSLSSVTLSPSTVVPHYALSNDCSASLAAGAKCALQVQFVPKVAGDLSGNVIISTTAANATVTVPVTASATSIGQLTPMPSSVGLTPATVGWRSTTTVVLKNTGGAPVDRIVAASAQPQVLTASDCPASLPAQATCNLTLTFQPTSEGSATGTVTLTHSGGNSPVSLPWSGVASSPSVTLITQPHPTAFVGQATSATHTLKNTGGAALPVLSNLTGTQALAPKVSGAAFKMVGTTCGTQLDAGQSCTVTTQCVAGAAGQYVAALQVGYFGGTAHGPLSCVVSAIPLVVSPDTVETLQAGGWSRSGTWYRVRNAGTLSATLQGFAAQDSNWTLTAQSGDATQCTAGKVLAPGASCKLLATLVTGAPGQVYSASHQVLTSGGNVAWNARLQMLGVSASAVTGFPAKMQNGRTYTAQYQLKNEAPHALDKLALTLTGSGFTRTSTTCGTRLEVGGACLVTLAYAAPLSGSSASASLGVSGAYPQVVSGVAGASVASGVQGRLDIVSAVVPPLVTITPGAYPAIPVGGTVTATHTVRNEGVGPVALTAPVLNTGTQHQVVGTTCGTALDVGQACTVTTRFTPTSTSNLNATLTVPYANLTAVAALQGRLALPSDVQVKVAANPALTVVKGGTVTFTATVSNGVAGPADIVLDLKPVAGGGATIATAAAPVCATGVTCTVSGNSVRFSLNANQVATVSQALTTSNTAGNVTWSATATPSGVVDPTASNNTDSKSVTVADPGADLSVELSNLPTTWTLNGTGKLLVTVKNKGPQAAKFDVGVKQATGATATINLGTSVCTAVGTGGNSTVASCTAGSTMSGYLPGAGSTATFSIPVTVGKVAGLVTLTANVIPTTIGVADPVPANNTVTETRSAQ